MRVHISAYNGLQNGAAESCMQRGSAKGGARSTIEAFRAASARRSLEVEAPPEGRGRAAEVSEMVIIDQPHQPCASIPIPPSAVGYG